MRVIFGVTVSTLQKERVGAQRDGLHTRPHQQYTRLLRGKTHTHDHKTHATRAPHSTHRHRHTDKSHLEGNEQRQHIAVHVVRAVYAGPSAEVSLALCRWNVEVQRCGGMKEALGGSVAWQCGGRFRGAVSGCGERCIYS